DRLLEGQGMLACQGKWPFEKQGGTVGLQYAPNSRSRASKPIPRRRAGKLGLILAAAACLSFTSLPASRLPEPEGFVSDLAEKLSPATTQELEARLMDFKSRSNGIDLAVVTIPYEALGGLPIEKYSLQLARHWGIGSRGKRKDGLLLLIANKPQDNSGIYHGSTRLEVSRSLERDLSSNDAAGLVALMHDHFVAGRFDEAVKTGVQAIIVAVAQKRGFSLPAPTPGPPPQ